MLPLITFYLSTCTLVREEPIGHIILHCISRLLGKSYHASVLQVEQTSKKMTKRVN